LLLVFSQPAWAKSAESIVRRANNLYRQGSFSQAVGEYDKALVEKPDAAEPKFDKADSYYRLDDVNSAMGLYKQVAAETKNMNLVEKAKYNLGNSFFQQGVKQKDSNPQKALEDLKTGIECWRSVLDIDPKNEKAAGNIEVARLIIKDLIDRMNKQKQQDANQPQEPNKPQQNKQQQNQQQPATSDQQPAAKKQDANKPKEPNQPKEEKGEPNQQNNQRQFAPPDATAQQILNREEKQRKERQILERAQYQKVDKDW